MHVRSIAKARRLCSTRLAAAKFALGCIVLAVGDVRTLEAQVIAVSHPAGGTPSGQWYREAREDQNVKRDAQNLPTLWVPDGGRVCVQLVEPNTLLGLNQ